MKKLITFLSLSCIVLFACKKDNDSEPQVPATPSTELTVEQKNRAALIYFGEDWCGPCGSVGGPTLDSCLKSEGSLLTGFKVTRSSNNTSLNWTTGSSAFWSQYSSGVFGGSTGIPALAVNGTQQSLFSIVSANAAEALQKANAFAAQPVIAGIALRKTITGDSISVETKVKFYNNIAAGTDYRIAVYVLEDKVVSTQSTYTGTVNDYVYRNLVRVSGAPVYTGVTMNNSAAISSEQEFSNTFKMYLKPLWVKSNLKVVGIIWKIGGTPAQIINSNVAN
jgi:hypothetical protein